MIYWYIFVIYLVDWRVRPLVLVVKLWAQCQNINNAKNMTISSYSLVLMVIHFLQCKTFFLIIYLSGFITKLVLFRFFFKVSNFCLRKENNLIFFSFFNSNETIPKFDFYCSKETKFSFFKSTKWNSHFILVTLPVYLKIKC